MYSTEAFDPQFLPAETDSIFVVTQRLYTLQQHIRDRVVREIEMMANRGVYPFGVDSGSMAIESLLESVLSLSDILNTTQPARDEIYNVRGVTRNHTFGLVGGTRGVSRKSI